MVNRLIILLLINLNAISCTQQSIGYLALEKKAYQLGDTIKLKKSDNLQNIVFNKKSKDYLILNPDAYALGTIDLTITAKSNQKNLNKTVQVPILSDIKEKKIEFEVVKELNHNPDLFTQGLLINQGLVYESSGLYGKSKVIKYKLGSQKDWVEKDLPKEIFAEGITLYNGDMYLLTWKEGIVYKIDASTFEIKKEIKLPTEINEGWGITNSNEHIYISNGTSKIYKLNKDFQIISNVQVVGHEKIYTNLNELEYHDGFLYANVWQDSIILKIDPLIGQVVGKLELSELIEQNDIGTNHVLNGIAFNSNGNMMITGKNWHNLFELQFIK